MDLTQYLLTHLGNIGLFVCAALATTSVAVHLRVPWWTTPMGRHLMAYMLVIAAILDMAAARVLFGDAWWFSMLRFFIFLLGLPPVLSWRLFLQIKAQREVKNAER